MIRPSLGELLEGATLSPRQRVKSDRDRPTVMFHTPFARPDDGWSVAARRYARAMHEAGLDVRLVSFDEAPEELDPSIVAEVGACLKYADRWDLHLLSAAVTHWKHTAACVSTLAYDAAPGAMHVVFERLRVEPELAEVLNNLSGVWAQCSANRDALVRAGVRDVELIGMPYFDDDPLLQIPKPDRSDRFLYVGRVEFRKSPERLVRAFTMAFKPGEASLTIKLSKYSGYGSDVQSHEFWTAVDANPNVTVLQGELARDQMESLYANHDVYCSASRGEGWDLPAYHMKLAGRRLAMTDSGGPRDFAADGDALVPVTGEVLDLLGHPYADHNMDHLVEALQLACSKPGPGSRVPEHLNSRVIGRKFREWVERLTA